MKKTIAVILCVSLITCLAACGTGEAAPEPIQEGSPMSAEDTGGYTAREIALPEGISPKSPIVKDGDVYFHAGEPQVGDDSCVFRVPLTGGECVKLEV